MLANARQEYAFAIVDPAVVPDADSFVRPKRATFVVAGVLFGLILGIAVASIRWVRRGSEAASRG